MINAEPLNPALYRRRVRRASKPSRGVDASHSPGVSQGEARSFRFVEIHVHQGWRINVQAHQPHSIIPGVAESMNIAVLTTEDGARPVHRRASRTCQPLGGPFVAGFRSRPADDPHGTGAASMVMNRADLSTGPQQSASSRKNGLSLMMFRV